jgi:serine/threonine-protein kinase
MSPEACESKRDIDHRTDIYALGVLLFQMMTGVLPFDGESMGEVLVKQVTMLPPAPRGMNPAIPPSVEQILLRCLAKPVDARFATMLQLREALLDPEGYLRGSPPIAPARSVGSGAGIGEARTVAMQAAGPAAQAVSAAALQKTRLAMTNPLPLPGARAGAAAPTLIAEQAPHAQVRRATAGMPALAQPQEPKMNTMRIATPMGYSSRPPRKVWPVVLGMALLLGVGGGVLSVTCFGHDSGARPELAAGKARGDSTVADSDSGGGRGSDPETERSSARGGAAVVATGSDAGDAAIRTAASATAAGAPAGSGAAGIANGSGKTGGGAAGGAVSGATLAGGTGSAGALPSGSVGGPARTTFPSVRTVHLAIESVPAGAQVKAPGGDVLGKTPLAVDWPTSDAPVTFELRLAGYRTRQKQTVINGNTRLVIELERAPAGRHPPGSGSGKGGGAGNGLMRPDE